MMKHRLNYLRVNSFIIVLSCVVMPATKHLARTIIIGDLLQYYCTSDTNCELHRYCRVNTY